MTASGWREGHRSLAARVQALPDLMRHALAAPLPATGVEPGAPGGFVVTGVGSSAAHARLLVHLLGEHLGLRARYRALGEFVAEPAPGTGAAEERAREILVVISQGISPNARLALAGHARWRRAVLLTATGAAADESGAGAAGERRRLVGALAAAGVEVHRFAGGEDEYETLVRVTGPLAGYLCVLRFAAALAGALGRPPPYDARALAAVPDALAAAGERAGALGIDDPGACLGGRLAFLARGSYAELVDNLRYKVLEGMLRPLPPVWELLQLAHGPFQELEPHPTTLLALVRPGDASERDLLARAATMLDPARHRLIRLEATLPGALALFEHEALMNELMLRFIAARAIDQVRWPGRGRETALYDLGGDVALPGAPPGGARAAGAARALAALAWPEVERLCASAPCTAVVPLGSTEQHGPHLACGTDTWIADALGARLCARLPEAILLPTLPVGCASEHLDFPGTLHLQASTLAALLADLAASLRRHGFARAFIFSAHGGNFAPLAAALPAIRQAAAPMEVEAFTDLARLTALWHEASAGFGVAAAASGHHAGEFETSIVRALRPTAVRPGVLAAGALAADDAAQALFYPSLRAHAPSGTVGDPRTAAAERGERYLDAWTELLLAAYRREKKSA